MKFKTTCRGLLAALLAVIVTGEIARAGSVTIPDFSFEKTVIAAGGATGNDNVGTNWSASQGNGSVLLQNITNTLFTPTGANTLPQTGDGTNYLVEQLNVAGSGNAAYCFQDIGPLQSNTIYTLTIAVGQSLAGSLGQGFIGLVNGTTPFNTLLAATPVDNSVLTSTPGTFADATVVFTTGNLVSGELTILMEQTNGAQLLFDNVRLSTAAAANPTALLPALSSPSGTVYVGTVVTLGENPAGTSPFTYQWQSDHGTAGASFTSLLLATNANYVVTNSSVSSVEYRVIVTNSLGNSSTSAPVTLTVIQGPPVIVQDTLPALTPADVVGSAVTFTVMFDGDRPLTYHWQVDYGSGPGPVAGTTANGTTNATLTLTNLQISDTGIYSCVVSNDQSGSAGTTTSTGTFFTVNPVPAADSFGVIMSPANQYGLGGQTEFTPTWAVATNSLIKGLLPTTTSAGNFKEAGCGGTNFLTDGAFGALNPEGTASPGLATAGNPTSGAGSFVTYTLPASANGWDITNIVVYGGWSDGGRDQQSYNVLYSTIAAPTNFNSQLTQVNYLPSPNDAATPPDQSATRITLTSTNANRVLLHNVAAVEFFFGLQNASSPVNENGWEGYAELQVFGAQSAPAPVWVTNMVPATGTDVTGSSLTMYAVASSGLPLTYQWTAVYADGHGTGAVTGTAPAGTTNSSLTLVNLQQSDSGTYTLMATNATGKLTSLPCAFLVNAAPGTDGLGVIDSPASQTGNAAILSPTWTVAPGSLIAGKLPSAFTVGGGNGLPQFMLETATNGVSVLTDGQVGFVGNGNDASMVTCGSTAGQTLTYTLTGSQFGYDITNMQVFGGWTDNGRDEQNYTISYSTVSAPSTFTVLTSYDDVPPHNGAPNMTRMTYTTGSASPLATHVAKVLINFLSPLASGGENNYEGYSEIDIYGTPSASETVPPYAASDTMPSLCQDVVGSQETFTTSFGSSAALTYQWQVDYGLGAGPQPVPGATSPTLTLSNLQLTNSGSYSCVATSSTGLGTATSTPNNLLVVALPAATNNILVLGALQGWSNTVFAPTFTPTWTVQAGSLIAGATPSSVGTGSFTKGANGGQVGGGVSVLTDGQAGTYGDNTDTTLATGGSSATSGQSVTYTLTGAANGYNLSRIVTYGGWGDAGRDEQSYVVSYSTVSAPTVFIPLNTNDYRPANPPISIVAEPNSSRVTTISANGGPLAVNVAKVQFNFTALGGAAGTTAGGENGWQGYAELQVFGAPALAFNLPVFSGGNLILGGVGGTPGGGYTVLTTTNVAAPLSTWTTNSQAVFDGAGAFSNAIPVLKSQPARFFEIRVP